MEGVNLPSYSTSELLYVNNNADSAPKTFPVSECSLTSTDDYNTGLNITAETIPFKRFFFLNSENHGRVLESSESVDKLLAGQSTIASNQIVSREEYLFVPVPTEPKPRRTKKPNNFISSDQLQNVKSSTDKSILIDYNPSNRWVSKWSVVHPELHPCCNPLWLERIQNKLPWYERTLKEGGGPWLSMRPWEVPYQWCLRELQERWNNKAERWLLCIRLTLAGGLIVTLCIINVIIRADLYVVDTTRTQIYDAFHELTNGLNKWINESATGFSVLLFLASFLMDMLFLLIWAQWIIIGDSWRLPIAYGMLYTIRGLMRSICIFPTPDGYIWRIPTFGSISIPSLTVPYQASDDFFFSGHVGCGALAIFEHYYYRCWWGIIVSLIITLYQVFVLTITRGHFMIDMVIGVIVASWCHMIAQIICRPVDQWFGLPPRFVRLPPSRNSSVRTVVKYGNTELAPVSYNEVTTEKTSSPKSIIQPQLFPNVNGDPDLSSTGDIQLPNHIVQSTKLSENNNANFRPDSCVVMLNDEHPASLVTHEPSSV